MGSWEQRCTCQANLSISADSRNWPPLTYRQWSRTACWRKQGSKGRFWKCFQTLTLSRSARPGRLKRVSNNQPHTQGLASPLH